MSNLELQKENNWYAPLETQPEAPVHKKTRLTTGWKIFVGTLGAVLLITLSSLAFSSGKGSDVPLPPKLLCTGEQQQERGEAAPGRARPGL